MTSNDTWGRTEDPGNSPADDTATADAPGRRKRSLWWLWTLIGVLGLGGVLYATDIIMSEGNVPRGVTVGGVDIGDMSYSQAEARLRNELAPGTRSPSKSPPVTCPPASTR